MNTFFEIALALFYGWWFLTQLRVYDYTGAQSYGVTSLGAGLNLLFFAVRDAWEFAGLLKVLGLILFSGGIATTITFGSKLEIARLRTSSWKELFLGSVPASLRKGGPNKRDSGLLVSFFLIFSAIILFLADKSVTAIYLAVFGVVLGVYSVRPSRGN